MVIFVAPLFKTILLCVEFKTVVDDITVIASATDPFICNVLVGEFMPIPIFPFANILALSIFVVFITSG